MKADVSEPSRAAEGSDGRPASLDRARQAQLAGELAEAEDQYRRLLARSPQLAEAWHGYGLLAYQRGDGHAAVQRIEQALSLDPDNAHYSSNLGMARLALGHQQRARACFERCLALEPRFAPAHFQLGLLALSQGRHRAAAERFERAADIVPDFREAHYNLAVSLGRQGQYEGAVAAYRRALAADPHYLKARGNLANSLHRLERWDEALAEYRHLQRLDPHSGLAQHMVAALTGQTTGGAPADYVAELFDGCAADFDTTLVDELHYRTPQALRQLIERVIGAESPAKNALDLGCGTGLAGKELRRFCQRLVGVDLSSEMLAHAAATGLYDQLERADIASYLNGTAERFGLLVAADVLAYCGDLQATFDAMARCCVAGGWVAFSTELAVQSNDYQLQRSGRYAHRQDYVQHAVERAGFRLCFAERNVLRLEAGQPVSGLVVLCERVR